MRLMLGAMLFPLCLVAAAGGAEPTLLRWKLKADDTFVVHTEQQTEADVAFSGKSARTTIAMQMDIRWRVASANDAKYVVRQSIERLAASLTTATGVAEFDSATKTRSVGLAKQLADSLQPLVGAEIEIELNDRGEVLSVKPANEAGESLFQQRASDSAGNSASAVYQVLTQSILRLPAENVAEETEWQAARELATPAGTLQQETTYRVAGFIERGEEQLCRIQSQSKFAPEQPTAPAAGAAKPTVKIVEHEQSGVILFSPEAGRVVESEQTQKLVTERVYRDTTIKVTLHSSQKSTVQQ